MTEVSTPKPDIPDAHSFEPVRRVGLFATCLVDFFRPSIGFATVLLLERAGFEVEVPERQTCCGQPAYNSGDAQSTREVARQIIETFEPYDYVVGPSGSCIGMIKEHYPRLFAADAAWRGRAQALADRSYEALTFLREFLDTQAIDVRHSAKVTYHDSCSGLRELGIRDQPRELLSRVDALEIVDLEDSNVCCGFGGTFCVKYPKISEKLVADKVGKIEATGAEMLLGGDLGCLLNIAGRLKRSGSKVKVLHAVEVLAGMAGKPGIGD